MTQSLKENEEELRKQAESLKKQAREIEKRLPKKHRKKLLPKSIKVDEFPLLIKSIPDKKGYKESKVAILLAYESGLRIAEVKNLLPKDFDLKQKSIFVRQGKFGKDRVVPLPKTWRAWMFDHIPIKKSIRSLQRNFRTATKKAKLNTEYTFHSLRHGFATRMLERKVPLNQIQLLMGHANISATNVYVQARPEDALNSYEELF